ncbi:hypothetical protein [Sphingorhabdus sp. EL138]|uniref:hypothetical protein n=1 Tax=Sphingorhabdus sp. EL138 TaxID=2073156 RepID=UPI000D685DBE|nr:hypothetical protein [Sphingorhabdus sp. EL138]
MTLLSSVGGVARDDPFQVTKPSNPLLTSVSLVELGMNFVKIICMGFFVLSNIVSNLVVPTPVFAQNGNVFWFVHFHLDAKDNRDSEERHQAKTPKNQSSTNRSSQEKFSRRTSILIIGGISLTLWFGLVVFAKVVYDLCF